MEQIGRAIAGLIGIGMVAAVAKAAIAVPRIEEEKDIVAPPDAQPTGEMRITELKVEPLTLMLGETVTISYILTNVGTTAGYLPHSVVVNDRVIKEKDGLWYQPGDWTLESVKFTPDKIGRYTVEVDGSFAYFTVTEWKFPQLTDSLPVAPQGVKLVRVWLETIPAGYAAGFPGICAEVEITMGSILKDTVAVRVYGPRLYAGHYADRDRYWTKSISSIINVPPGSSTFTFILPAETAYVYQGSLKAQRFGMQLQYPKGVKFNSAIEMRTELVSPVQWIPPGWEVPALTYSDYSLRFPVSFFIDQLPPGAYVDIKDFRIVEGVPSPGATVKLEGTFELVYWIGDSPPNLRLTVVLVGYAKKEDKWSTFSGSISGQIIGAQIGTHTISDQTTLGYPKEGYEVVKWVLKAFSIFEISYRGITFKGRQASFKEL